MAVDNLAMDVSLVSSKNIAKYVNTSSSPTAQSTAWDVIELYEDTVRRFGYTFLSIASIFGDTRPVPPPFNVSYYDPLYPSSPSTMPEEVSTIKVEVSAAAKAVSNYVKQIKVDYPELAKKWENVQKQVHGGCVCPTSASIQNITDSWTKMNRTLTAYYKVTSTSYSLIGYVNSTILGQVMSLFDATSSMILSFQSCSKCLLDGTKNGDARNIKRYCNGINMESVSTGVTDTTCIAHGNRAIDRVTKNVRMTVLLRQRQAERAHKDMIDRMYIENSKAIKMMDGAVTNYQKNYSFILTGRFEILGIWNISKNFELFYKFKIFE